MLTGKFERVEKEVDLNRVMCEINDTLKEEEARQLAIAIRLATGARRLVFSRMVKAIRLEYITCGKPRDAFLTLNGMYIQPHKENDHGQRTTAQEQGSEETQEEANSGDLISAPSLTATTGGSRPGADIWVGLPIYIIADIYLSRGSH